MLDRAIYVIKRKYFSTSKIEIYYHRMEEADSMLNGFKLIFNQKPDKSVGFFVWGKRSMVSIHTTMSNPKETDNTGDIII